MLELAKQSSSRTGEPAPAEEVPVDPLESALYPEDNRVNQQMALLLAKENQRPSSDFNNTFRIDLPEDREPYEPEAPLPKKNKKKKSKVRKINAGFVDDEVLPTRLANPQMTEQPCTSPNVSHEGLCD